MSSKYLIASIVVLTIVELCHAGGHGGGHKKVIIHVPYKVKTIHHTHTVYKHVGGGGGGDEGYKVIGYSGDGDVALGHGHEVHGDEGGEHAGGFTVGGDHGYWHSGGHDGGSVESHGHDFAGSFGHSEGLESYAGHEGGGDVGGAGYDLSHDSYGNALSGEGGHDLGGYGYGGGEEGHHGYD